MEKFRNKYRTKSIRLEGYDYSQEGLYFLTICTQNHVPHFGKIKDGIMQLNSAGKIVADEWRQTIDKRDRVVLGEWIVMPNHFHAVVYLKPKSKSCRDASNASGTNVDKTFKGMNGRSLDGRGPSLQDYKNQFGPQRDNVSSIIRGFKSSCTSRIWNLGMKNFAWQRGFYGHIIRSQRALLKIEEYIRENPQRWNNDRYYPKS